MSIPLRLRGAWWLGRRLGVLGLCLLLWNAVPAQVPASSAEAWFEAGRPGAAALQALDLLAGAASHGLDPADYRLAALRRMTEAAAGGPPPDAAAREALALALGQSMQRFLLHLHQGRVDPASVHSRFRPVRREPYDPAAALQAALQGGSLEAAVRDAVPALPLYERLRQALQRYRELGSPQAWRAPLPALPGRPGKLEPGASWPGVQRLAERLVLLGDLPDGQQPPAGTQRYEGALVEAVRAFQRRHALTDDGVIGAATRARLEVAPAARVRQIELTLERLRWTPVMRGPRMIVINLPEFVLRAYEVREGRIVVREQMRVIVGKALDARTPVFDEDLQSIEFSPYWNVPWSIARAELVPRLRRDPGHFAQQGFEFVAADGSVHGTLSAGWLDAVLAGRARLRQRPGPRNALGDIKFVFPNRDHIYLHHTPSVGLFERDRRDFSHGCIRLEAPLALARFALDGMAGWDEARIREAMERGESNTVRLAAPVPVLIAYGTVLTDGTTIRFFDDLYGHDRRLDAALRQRSAAPDGGGTTSAR